MTTPAAPADAPADRYAQFTGTRPVAPQHAFDLGRLAEYLHAHMADLAPGAIGVEQFKGGQSNPTFLITAADGRRYVMRRKPPGTLLPSAHAVDREFRVIRALEGSEVPVARAHVLCEDPSVIGTSFYLMDCVEGRVLWDPTLPDMSPDQRGAIYDEMNRVIAALHRVDPMAVGLEGYGKVGGYLERQVKRWITQYRAAETEKIPAMEALIQWLPERIPAENPTRIVHGDYRLDNVMFHPTEPRIVAVLDWELSTLGHPLADIAYGCILYHSESESWGTLRGIDLAASGIPGEAEYVAAYCRRTGRSGIPDFNAYLAFSMFRLAAIGQGVYKRNLIGIGNAPASRDNSHTRHLAATACAILDR